MGSALTDAIEEHVGDLWNCSQGQLPSERVRWLQIKDALLDTGATTLALPTRMIRALDLHKTNGRSTMTCGGKSRVAIFEAVRLTIMDRFCTVDVMEVPDDVPPLIGQIPLEALDLVIDSRNHRLTGNPAHGGEHIMELL
ncbi:MAG: aspartyl protease family protein [Pirellulales bacterium]